MKKKDERDAEKKRDVERDAGRKERRGMEVMLLKYWEKKRR